MKFTCKNCGKALVVNLFPVYCSCGLTHYEDGDTFLRPDPPPLEGVGTELKKLFEFFRVRQGRDCDCERIERLMNANGIKWCQDNQKEILEMLAENANSFSEIRSSRST